MLPSRRIGTELPRVTQDARKNNANHGAVKAFFKRLPSEPKQLKILHEKYPMKNLKSTGERVMNRSLHRRKRVSNRPIGNKRHLNAHELHSAQDSINASFN